MSEPFLAEIRMFGGNFAPKGWAFCAGQLMPISQNTALFSLLGTAYGGDGKSTFALPDLRGSAATGAGQSQDDTITFWELGEVRGDVDVTLTEAQLATHTHQVQGSTADNDTSSPANALAGVASAQQYRPDSDGQMAPLPQTGGSQPHDNQQPYLTVTFIIALQGMYPQRP